MPVRNFTQRSVPSSCAAFYGSLHPSSTHLVSCDVHAQSCARSSHTSSRLLASRPSLHWTLCALFLLIFASTARMANAQPYPNWVATAWTSLPASPAWGPWIGPGSICVYGTTAICSDSPGVNVVEVGPNPIDDYAFAGAASVVLSSSSSGNVYTLYSNSGTGSFAVTVPATAVAFGSNSKIGFPSISYTAWGMGYTLGIGCYVATYNTSVWPPVLVTSGVQVTTTVLNPDCASTIYSVSDDGQHVLLPLLSSSTQAIIYNTVGSAATTITASATIASMAIGSSVFAFLSGTQSPYTLYVYQFSQSAASWTLTTPQGVTFTGSTISPFAVFADVFIQAGTTLLAQNQGGTNAWQAIYNGAGLNTANYPDPTVVSGEQFLSIIGGALYLAPRTSSIVFLIVFSGGTLHSRGLCCR
eukprot:TRINITY_DN4515_c0_g1_i2.p1 TRINITY_DN4515_c0_g1~~TRINITY_DN4515_c0_g1_i2.p1  ORF type:complete len:414 (-),score=37.65 TRINITY_DN4515_c0_g1_i2:912-2153(-)